MIEALNDNPQESLPELIREAIDRTVSDNYQTCKSLLEERGEREEDLVSFYTDHPEYPGLVRAYGYQGENHHAIFFVQMFFVAGEPNFTFDVEPPTVREGMITGD